MRIILTLLEIGGNDIFVTKNKYQISNYFFSNSFAYNLKEEIKIPKLNQKTQNIINLAIFLL